MLFRPYISKSPVGKIQQGFFLFIELFAFI